MEQFYVFMVNSFWDSTNTALGCLRESTHLHMLWQCQIIAEAFNHHMNERQSCLKALKQCRLNWILPSWRWGAGALFSFLLRKGDKEESAELEWKVKEITEERQEERTGKPEKCGQLLLLCPAASSPSRNLPFCCTNGRLVSNPLLWAMAPAGAWTFYFSFFLLFP